MSNKVRVKTVKTLYFDYDGDTWTDENPKEYHIEMVYGTHYTRINKGAILYFENDAETFGKHPFVGSPQSGTGFIAFSSENAMWGTGWFRLAN
jgi:hypothetical protein